MTAQKRAKITLRRGRKVSRKRPRPPAPDAGFELAGGYTSADARLQITNILLAAEQENKYAGISGTDAIPAVIAEGMTGFRGPELSVTIPIDDLRKNWRIWMGAIDAYDLSVAVSVHGRCIGALYRNPEYRGGIRSLRKYAGERETPDAVLTARLNDLTQQVKALPERLREAVTEAVDDGIGPLKRHMAGAIRQADGLHPTVASQ